MLENKLIDGIIKEPVGGAHSNPEEAYELVKKEISKHLDKLIPLEADKRVANRIRKFSNMGVVNEGKK